MAQNINEKKVNDDYVYLCLKDTEDGIRVCDQHGRVVRGVSGFEIGVGIDDISQANLSANLHNVEGEEVEFSVRGSLKTVK